MIRFPSCGSVSAAMGKKEIFFFLERNDCKQKIMRRQLTGIAQKFNHNTLTFTHFLFKLFQRWFNQFPTIWLTFTTSTDFWHIFARLLFDFDGKMNNKKTNEIYFEFYKTFVNHEIVKLKRMNFIRCWHFVLWNVKFMCCQMQWITQAAEWEKTSFKMEKNIKLSICKVNFVHQIDDGNAFLLNCLQNESNPVNHSFLI